MLNDDDAVLDAAWHNPAKGQGDGADSKANKAMLTWTVVFTVFTVIAMATVLLVAVTGWHTSPVQEISGTGKLTYDVVVNGGSVQKAYVTIDDAQDGRCHIRTTTTLSQQYAGMGIPTPGGSSWFDYSMRFGVWSSDGLMFGAVDDEHFNKSVNRSTALGDRVLDVYRTTTDSGWEVTVYAPRGTAMPFLMEMTNGTDNVVWTLADTNIQWLR